MTKEKKKVLKLIQKLQCEFGLRVPFDVIECYVDINHADLVSHLDSLVNNGFLICHDQFYFQLTKFSVK